MHMPTEVRAPSMFTGLGAASRAVEDAGIAASRSEAPVLITGEAGVGKAVVARLIHDHSRRAGAPMLAVNCAGLPEVLLESVLFGHMRGSFTGAYSDKAGVFETASHSTVFLDNIGELGARMQTALLMFLDTGDIRPIGAHGTHMRSSARLIAATSRDVRAQVRSGAFDPNLWTRLSEVQIDISPLRDRATDVSPLAELFLRQHAGLCGGDTPKLSTEAIAALAAYRWPGNTRELKRVIERIALRRGDRIVGLMDLPVEISRPGGLSCNEQPARAEGSTLAPECP